MVLEGLGCADARCAAGSHYMAAEDAIRQFVARRHPGHADRLTDLVSTTMAGLSAQAWQGVSAQRLMAVAQLCGGCDCAHARRSGPVLTATKGRRESKENAMICCPRSTLLALATVALLAACASATVRAKAIAGSRRIRW
ncbi:hypothetical protein [Luteimonas sp. A482]